jgi:hypothetical protein
LNNQKTPVRRKWAFEKGQNSSSVLLAGLVTAALTAGITGIFRYEYHSANLKQQSSVLSMIDPELNQELFKEIHRRDPARTYGVTGGSFTGLAPERNYQIDLNVDLTGKIPEYPSAVPQAEFSGNEFPVSGKYASILPANNTTANNTGSKNDVKVFAPDGKIHVLKNLSALTGNIRERESIVKISGSGLLCRGETIRSCGDKKIDRMAEQILKAAELPPGIYVISWKNKGAEK